MNEHLNDTQKKKIDIFLIVVAPLKYKIPIIIINIIVAIGVVSLVTVSKRMPPEKSFMPNIYTSQAKILLPSQESGPKRGMGMQEIETMINSMGMRFDRGVRTSQVILNILHTNSLVDSVVTEHLLVKKPQIRELFEQNKLTKEALRNMVSANAHFDIDDSAGLMYIGYTDIDPVFAKETVEVYLEMLNRATYNYALTRTTFKKRFIQERIKEIEERLEKAKKDFIAFQLKYGVTSPDREAIELTTTVAGLRSELMNKETELQKYFETHKTDSYSYEQLHLEVEIKNLKEKIVKLTRGSDSESFQDNILMSKSMISQLSLEFYTYKRNVEDLQTIYANLMNELELTQIQEKSEGPILQVLDPPEVPTQKSGPSRSMFMIQIIAVSIIMTLAVPMVLTFVKTFIAHDEKLQEKLKVVLAYLSFKKIGG